MTESPEQDRERCAQELATTEEAFRADPDIFVIWREDPELDSTNSGDDVDRSDSDPYPFYECLLCRDIDSKADLTRGYDPRDGIFERPGVIVGILGGIDLGPDARRDGPYKRVIVTEMYAELQTTRESALVRGEN